MDTTQAAIKKATEVNGSVRVISKTTGVKGQTDDVDRGVTQVCISSSLNSACLLVKQIKSLSGKECIHKYIAFFSIL